MGRGHERGGWREGKGRGDEKKGTETKRKELGGGGSWWKEKGTYS
jgi:hypothetical protein